MFFLKHKKVLLATLLLALLITSYFVSYIKLGVFNPFVASISLARIATTDVDYIEVQRVPQKIILAQPDGSYNNLNEYMSSLGFTLDDRMGSLLTFKSAEQEVIVTVSTNQYFSKWHCRTSQESRK